MGIRGKVILFAIGAISFGIFILGASPLPTPFPSPSSLGSRLSVEPITAAVKEKTLLREFQKAQTSEVKAIEHRHKFELKELKASQALRLKDWEKKEQDARHQYFAVHNQGPERRAYIQDFIKRREAFRKSLTEEKSHHTQVQDARLTNVRQEQQKKFKEFKMALDQGKDPETHLWPHPGH